MPDRYASLKQGLVGAWIPSISGSGLLLPDLSGYGNHGTLTNMGPEDWVSGQYGRALDFDGSNDLVNIGNVSLFNFGTGPFSVSLWFRAVPFAARSALLSKDDWDLGTTGLLIYSESGTPNHIFYYSSGTTGTSFGAIADSTWHHIAISRRSTLANSTFLYLDGRLISIITDSLNYSNSRRLRIGNDDDGNRSFPGQLDNVMIFNRSLSPAEIRLLASEPGIGFKPAKKLSRFSQRFTYKPPKAKTYGVVRVKETDHANLRQGLVGAWCPSIAGSGNLLPDVSGYNNHGSLVNMGPEDWVSAQYGRALDFDGVNDYILTSLRFGPGTTPFSVCCWYNGRDTNAFGPMSTSRPASFNVFTDSAWGLIHGNFITGDANKRVSFGLFQALAWRNCITNDNVITNTWRHYCAVSTGSAIEIFVDGVSVATTLTSDGAWPTSTLGGVVSLHGSNDGAVRLGNMSDDHRIYNRALSESEIRLLASRPGIGLRQDRDRNTFYQFPSGARRRRILTGMP